VGRLLAGESGNFARPGVLLGTVVPVNTPLTARPDLFLTFRNFGAVNLWGGDLGFDLQVSRRLALSGGGSWVSRDFFPAGDVGRPTPVALNASRLKGSLTLTWRDDLHGYSLELGGRALRGFPVTSGVYESPRDPADPGRLLPIDSYAVLDLQGTWRPPLAGRPLLLSLGVSNLLNRHYQTFAGLPNLGRLLLTRVRWSF
jgi:iron complex outermembrane receptor protein